MWSRFIFKPPQSCLEWLSVQDDLWSLLGALGGLGKESSHFGRGTWDPTDLGDILRLWRKRPRRGPFPFRKGVTRRANAFRNFNEELCNKRLAKQDFYFPSLICRFGVGCGLSLTPKSSRISYHFVSCHDADENNSARNQIGLHKDHSTLIESRGSPPAVGSFAAAGTTLEAAGKRLTWLNTEADDGKNTLAGTPVICQGRWSSSCLEKWKLLKEAATL
jgi:hypothetical protein